MTTSEKLSNTPRTDAKREAIRGNRSIFVILELDHMADFARQLERELNTAHADGAKLSEAVTKLSNALKAEKQRVFELLGEIDQKHQALRKEEAEQNSNAWWNVQSKL
jgi:flagellar biosynthesis chaperone FliJ